MSTATLSIVVSNHFGVLTKVTGLFGRRGYNIKSLSVGETHDPAISRITVQAEGDPQQLRQIVSQVRKLEEVFEAAVLPPRGHVLRELMLIKLKPRAEDVGALMQMATDFSAKCWAAGDSVILEASGETGRLNALIWHARKYNIVELSRTGGTALTLEGEPFFVDHIHREDEVG